ncbi:MAG: hypothetical protein R3E89_16315 [Thiolinea sp.]
MLSEGLRADRFWFMEMNTRLQVEHPVTEAITGLDLVEWQLRVAAGESLPFTQEDLYIRGHAFEARIYAEDPARGFVPAIGKLSHLHLPEQLARIDTGVNAGDTITPYYDPMIAKLTVYGENRTAALNQLLHALQDTRIGGCITNTGFLARLAAHPGFRRGEVDTGLIERELDSLTAAPEPDAELLAVTAFGLILHERQAAKHRDNPWDSLTGWGHWPHATATFIDLLWQEQLLQAKVCFQSAEVADISVQWPTAEGKRMITITVVQR